MPVCKCMSLWVCGFVVNTCENVFDICVYMFVFEHMCLCGLSMCVSLNRFRCMCAYVCGCCSRGAWRLITGDVFDLICANFQQFRLWYGLGWDERPEEGGYLPGLWGIGYPEKWVSLPCQSQGDGIRVPDLRLGGDWVLRISHRACIGSAQRPCSHQGRL